MVGDLVDKGVASIVTSSPSSEMISIHCLSSLVSLSSSTFSFLELSCYRASPALFELLSYAISASAFLELSFTNYVFISTKITTAWKSFYCQMDKDKRKDWRTRILTKIIPLDLSKDTKPYIKLRSLRSIHWDQQVVSDLVVKL
ncbi:hypothetical protein Tco_1149423 [Tanacetum coccineum]